MVWGGNRRRRSKCPQFCHCSGIHPFKDPLRRPFPREREKQTLIAAAVTAPSESSSFKRTGLPGSSCPLFAVMRSREGRRKNADATLHQYRADSFGTPQGAGDGARRPGENGTKQTKPCPKSAACRGMRRGFGPPTMFRQNSRKGASSHPGPREGDPAVMNSSQVHSLSRVVIIEISFRNGGVFFIIPHCRFRSNLFFGPYSTEPPWRTLTIPWILLP